MARSHKMKQKMLAVSAMQVTVMRENKASLGQGLQVLPETCYTSEKISVSLELYPQHCNQFS